MKSFSQDIPLTLEDLIPGGKTNYKYRAEMPRQINWHGDILTYVKGDSIMTVPLTEKSISRLFLSLNDINNGLKLNADESLRSLNAVQFVSGEPNNLLVVTAQNFYFYDFVEKSTKASFRNLENMENHEWS